MSKRLQVLLSESEWRELQRSSRAQGTTMAEWVRRALRAARRAESHGDAGRKLEVVRAAARHEYPVADIGQMLEEIERGYLGG
jgi:hypothetical protein